MDILSLTIIIFVILEIANMIMLYFIPGTKLGNGIGVFNAFEKSKSDPDIHALIKYLINWIAGTKLIFVLVLIVILVTGTELTKLLSVLALILAISSFFWRLYPSIKQLDRSGQITPKGYSKTLAWLISGFLLMFVFASVLYMAFF